MIELEFGEGFATLTLCHSPVNAISGEWVDAFNLRLDEISSDPACRALLIRSSQNVFGAGADLAEFRSRLAGKDGAYQTIELIRAIQKLYFRVAALPLVTVAEIAGAAVGGGLELALACDLRMAAREAKLGLPESKLGLIPGAGGTQRLTWLCGPGVSARLILAAEIIDGAEAASLGLVHWAVPRDQLRFRAAALMATICQLAPEAVVAAKTCLAAALDRNVDGFELECDATFRLLQLEDTRRRIADFLER